MSNTFWHFHIFVTKKDPLLQVPAEDQVCASRELRAENCGHFWPEKTRNSLEAVEMTLKYAHIRTLPCKKYFARKKPDICITGFPSWRFFAYDHPVSLVKARSASSRCAPMKYAHLCILYHTVTLDYNALRWPSTPIAHCKKITMH